MAMFDCVKEMTELKKILFEQRMIFLNSEINEETATEIINMMLFLNSINDEEITLYIDCEGGYNAGLNIYDIIKHSNAPVTGVVMRDAFSMAVVVLQACQKRLAFKHSKFLLHDVSVNSVNFEVFKIKEKKKLEEILEQVQKIRMSIFEILSEKTGKKLEEIEDYCSKERILNAEEAKKLGLIDEII